MAASAERVARLLGGADAKAVAVVIHGGGESQVRRGIRYQPWNDLQIDHVKPVAQ